MVDTHRLILLAAALVCIGGPFMLAVAGLLAARRTPAAPTATRTGGETRLLVNSAALYAVAFSVVFFIQELFLVVPKALVPGLRPTLFHNNHAWEGDDPIAHLLQGTGALAILLTAVACALWLRLRPPRTTNARLFVIWMIFHGLFQSLPQVVVGAIHPGNDVGMAMGWLELGEVPRMVAAFVALAAIAAVGLRLAGPLLAVAPHERQRDGAGNRTRLMFRLATLPALLALPVIILMRVPGTIDQVAIVPVAEAVIGIPWLQAGAWRRTRVDGTARPSPAASSRDPLLALAALILVFHLVLRPGIAFY